MGQQREIYKGLEIVINEPPAATATAGAGSPIRKLTIAGREIPFVQDAAGTFYTGYLPYTTYESAMDLAKAVIEHTEEFRTS